MVLVGGVMVHLLVEDESGVLSIQKCTIADILKSYTSIGQIVYRYWPNHVLLLVKSSTSIGEIV